MATIAAALWLALGLDHDDDRFMATGTAHLRLLTVNDDGARWRLATRLSNDDGARLLVADRTALLFRLAVGRAIVVPGGGAPEKTGGGTDGGTLDGLIVIFSDDSAHDASEEDVASSFRLKDLRMG